MRKITILDLKRVSAPLYSFLQRNDLKDLAVGRYDLDDGVFLYVKTYSTKTEAIDKIESHIKYLDIHYIIEGCERIAIYNKRELIIDEVQEENDIVIYKRKEPNKFVDLNEGELVLLGTGDAHLSGFAINKDIIIKKIVIKLPVGAI